MPSSWVDMDVNGETMEGYLTQPPEEGRYPAVVVIQEIWGVNSHIQYLTDRLPSLGYAALAPALFHREGRGTIGLHEEMPTAFERMGRCTDAGIVADLRAAVDYLKAQSFVDPNRIGIVGFCFGGRVSYLAACTIPDLKAASVYYGGRILQALGGEGPSPLEQTANINCPGLGLFGEDDQNPSPDQVKQHEDELKKHNKTYEFHTYPNAGHGFFYYDRAMYRQEQAVDGWQRVFAFFEKHLS